MTIQEEVRFSSLVVNLSDKRIIAIPKVKNNDSPIFVLPSCLAFLISKKFEIKANFTQKYWTNFKLGMMQWKKDYQYPFPSYYVFFRF